MSGDQVRQVDVGIDVEVLGWQLTEGALDGGHARSARSGLG
jgi:hypothetical protein